MATFVKLKVEIELSMEIDSGDKTTLKALRQEANDRTKDVINYLNSKTCHTVKLMNLKDAEFTIRPKGLME